MKLVIFGFCLFLTQISLSESSEDLLNIDTLKPVTLDEDSLLVPVKEEIPNDTLYCKNLNELNNYIYKNGVEKIDGVYEKDTIYSRADSELFTGVLKYTYQTNDSELTVDVFIWSIEEGIPKDETYRLYKPYHNNFDNQGEIVDYNDIELYCFLTKVNWGRKEFMYARYGSLIGIKDMEQVDGITIINGTTYFVTGEIMSTTRSEVIEGVVIQEEKTYDIKHNLRVTSNSRDYQDSMRVETTFHATDKSIEKSISQLIIDSANTKITFESKNSASFKFVSIIKDYGDSLSNSTKIFDLQGELVGHKEIFSFDSMGTNITHEKDYGIMNDLTSRTVVKQSDTVIESRTQRLDEQGVVVAYLYFYSKPNYKEESTITMKNEVDTTSYIREIIRDNINREVTEIDWDYELNERKLLNQRSEGNFTIEKAEVYNWTEKTSNVMVVKSDQQNTWGYTAWINEVNDTIQKYQFLNNQLHGISYDRFDIGGYNYITLELQWNKGQLIDIINTNVILIKKYKKIVTEADFIASVNKQKNGPVLYPIAIPNEMHKGLTEDFILFTERSFRNSMDEKELYDRLSIITKKVRRYREKYRTSS